MAKHPGKPASLWTDRAQDRAVQTGSGRGTPAAAGVLGWEGQAKRELKHRPVTTRAGTRQKLVAYRILKLPSISAGGTVVITAVWCCTKNRVPDFFLALQLVQMLPLSQELQTSQLKESLKWG